MPAPTWLHLSRKGAHLCGRGACTIALWTAWLLLGLFLCIQIFIMSSRELAVPGFLLREIDGQLEAAGLAVSFGKASFDPGGHVLLEDVRIDLSALHEPVFHADSIYLELNPLTLWFRQVEPRFVRISSGRLLIPSVLSPSGTSTPLVQRLNFSLRPAEAPERLRIEHLTGLVGDIPVDVQGGVDFPTSGGHSPPLDELLNTLSRHYLSACRQAATWLPRLPAHTDARLSLRLEPAGSQFAQVHARLQFAGLQLTDLPGLPAPLQLTDFTAWTRFDLGSEAHLHDLEFTLASASLPDRLTLSGLQGQLEALATPAAGRFAPRVLELAVERITVPDLDLPLRNLSLSSGIATLPQIQATLQAEVAAQPLAAHADLDVTTGAGRVSFTTALAPALLPLVGQRLGFDLPALLNWQEPPRLSAELNLGQNGRPLRATAAFSTGPVTARRVDLDATAARVSWSGTSLRADDILLVRQTSRATGSYEMDTKSLDFRFLLEGHLEPSDIDGWFRSWWPNFWASFQFPVAPPDASVEVSGRWKAPLLTRVWIRASGHDAVVKDIALDTLSSRLFIRPGWADVLEFHATRPPGPVQGSFSRSWRLPYGGARWTSTEVHATGTSDLDPLPKLLGDLGTRIAAPFDLDAPVDVRLDGRVERDDWGAPTTVDFEVSGHTSGTWTFFDFPLHGAEFTAHQTNERLLISPFSAGATGGALAGRIEVSGPSNQQNLAFDLNLAHAHLGQTIRTVETWFARRRGEEPSPESQFQQRIAEGVLDLSLSAEGPAGDPYAFQGQGAALIEDANLGELKLLGPLTALLGNSLLNFSSLQLDNANGDFHLNGRVVDFSDVKLTGPRGSIDGSGKYYLDTRNLDFLTRVRPFDGGVGNILDAVFTPITRALEVKLGGQLNIPRWTFVYGPTNILRTLTGSGPQADATAPESAAPAPPTPSAPDTARPPTPPPTDSTAPTDPEEISGSPGT